MRHADLIGQIEVLLRNVQATYDWKIPSICPIDFERTGQPITDNLNLRAACNELWRSQPAKRQKLAAWYVRTWGGVKRTTDASLSKYIILLETGKLPDRLKGVASWSKIAALSNPNKYLVYDARVAFALNALLIRAGSDALAFHLPASQNTILNVAKAKLKAHGIKDVNSHTPSADYNRYMSLLSTFRDRMHVAEMALFAAAPTLASELMASANI